MSQSKQKTRMSRNSIRRWMKNNQHGHAVVKTKDPDVKKFNLHFGLRESVATRKLRVDRPSLGEKIINTGENRHAAVKSKDPDVKKLNLHSALQEATRRSVGR
jgi:hypothetical protein